MTKAGRVAIVPKGEFISGSLYTRLDVVRYQNGNYVAKKDNVSVSPTIGEDDDNWMFMGDFKVDSALDMDSENPVQNKVIAETLSIVGGRNLVLDTKEEIVNTTTGKQNRFIVGWYDISDYGKELVNVIGTKVLVSFDARIEESETQRTNIRLRSDRKGADSGSDTDVTNPAIFNVTNENKRYHEELTVTKVGGLRLYFVVGGSDNLSVNTLHIENVKVELGKIPTDYTSAPEDKADNIAMTGATADTSGTTGLVPAPDAGKENSFLMGDGTWVENLLAIDLLEGAGMKEFIGKTEKENAMFIDLNIPILSKYLGRIQTIGTPVTFRFLGKADLEGSSVSMAIRPIDTDSVISTGPQSDLKHIPDILSLKQL